MGPAIVDAAGSVTGTVEGDLYAKVTSGGDVSGLVKSAGGDVSVDAYGDVAGHIDAFSFAQISAAGSVGGAIDVAVGGAWVYAGGDVAGDVTGVGELRVESGGTVSGEIRSANGDVSIVAVTVSGTAVAGQALTVEASDHVSASLTAVGPLAITSWGDVDGVYTSVTGGVELYAAGTAGGVGSAAGWLKVYGRDVDGAFQSTTGSVEVFAEGEFSGYAGALLGGVVVGTGGDFTGVVEAYDDVWVWAGGAVVGDLPTRTGGVYVWSGGQTVPTTPPAPTTRVEFFDITTAFAVAHGPGSAATGSDTISAAAAPRTIGLFIPVGEKDVWRQLVPGVRFVEDPRLLANGYVRIVMPLATRTPAAHNQIVASLAATYQLHGRDLQVAVGALYGGDLDLLKQTSSDGSMNDGSRVLRLLTGETDVQKRAISVGLALFGVPDSGMTNQQIEAEMARRRPLLNQLSAQIRALRAARAYPGGHGPAPSYATHRPPSPEELRLEVKYRRATDPLNWDVTSTGEVVPRGTLAGGLPLNMLALEADQARLRADQARLRAEQRVTNGYWQFLRVLPQIRAEYESLGLRDVNLRQIGTAYERYLEDYQAGQRVFARLLADPAQNADVMAELRQFVQEQRTSFEATLTGLPATEQARRRATVPWLYGNPENAGDPAYRYFRPMIHLGGSGTPYFSFVSTPALRALVLEQAIAVQTRVVGNLTDGYGVIVAPTLYVPSSEDEIAVWYARYGTTSVESIIRGNTVETNEQPLIADYTPLIVVASAGTAAGLATGQGATVLGAARAAGTDAAFNLSFIAISEAVTSYTNDPKMGFLAGASAVLGAIAARKVIVSPQFRRDIIFFLKNEQGTWFIATNARITNNIFVQMGYINTGLNPVRRDLAALDSPAILYRNPAEVRQALVTTLRRHFPDFDAKLAALDAVGAGNVERYLEQLSGRIFDVQARRIVALRRDTGSRNLKEIQDNLGSTATVESSQFTEATAREALDFSGVVGPGERVSVEVGGRGRAGGDIVVRRSNPRLNPEPNPGTPLNEVPEAAALNEASGVIARREVKSIITDNVNAVGNNVERAADQLGKVARADGDVGSRLEIFIQVRSDRGWTAARVTESLNTMAENIRRRLTTTPPTDPAYARALQLRDDIRQINRIRVVDQTGATLFDGVAPAIP